jgi:hypothetical protein
MDVRKVIEDIKRYHERGVNDNNIAKLVSRRYKVRKTDVETIIFTLRSTDYRWQKRGK